MSAFADFESISEKVFSRAQTRTRSIIEFANIAYRTHTILIETVRIHVFLQTSVQTRDKNAAISRNAPLATSAKREVPRATCNERKARSSPRNLQRAQSAKFPAQLATSAEREVPRATCNEREARSSPRRNRSVSPIKEKRFSVFRLRTLTTAIFQTALFIIPPL